MAVLRHIDPYTVFIPRKNKQLEARLDRTHVRCGRLQWAVKGEIWKRAGEFQGQHCHVVGKGPSLDRLTGFPDQQPVFAINESIIKVESLDLQNQIWATQLDHPKREVYVPTQAHMFCPPHRVKEYLALGIPCTIISHGEIGQHKKCLSVLYVMGIAKLLGFTAMQLWCFDACMIGNTDYAACVGYPPHLHGSPKRFLKHRRIIERAAGKLELIWKMP